MLTISKKQSISELHLKVEFPKTKNENFQHYEFHDTKHLHPRLIVIVKELKKSIYLEILPF